MRVLLTGPLLTGDNAPRSFGEDIHPPGHTLSHAASV
ncbi:entericidin EcnA/B family protein [Salmonella enterica subsp. salamae]|nr:entericidin EcnA/B family protein [Salmonella enterica subsp. salamae]ECJ2282694.1 entericidin EcnA/B family protein [Salmonella enterica subsp. salamae]